MNAQGSGALPSLPNFFSLIELESVGSTNDEARLRAEKGASAGTIVWAKQQVSGRGRRGRAWKSPAGNLYCSVVLRPEVSPAVAAQLSFVTALAIGEGLHGFLPAQAKLQYKWPNDVLIDGQKLSGILLESQVGEQGKLDWLLIGTGVNIASSPEDTDRPATNLNRVGIELSVTDVLTAYIHALSTWLVRWETAGFEPVREAWLNRAIGLGEAIEVRLPNETLTGTFEALDTSGSLVLTTLQGRQLISAGEVFVQG
jgi:BirA family biotin operon repressor/biotin-[acetyl-CoA-carboxylase] ligase